jgi:hypothetical protein
MLCKLGMQVRRQTRHLSHMLGALWAQHLITVLSNTSPASLVGRQGGALEDLVGAGCLKAVAAVPLLHLLRLQARVGGW